MSVRRSWAREAAVTTAVAGFALAFAPGAAAQGAASGHWPTYGGDLGSTRYAALAQIDASNFGKLEVAWRFSVANLGPTREFTFQSTPLVVDGVMYTTGGTRRAVTALDAATGEQLWVYSLNEGQRGLDAPRKLSGRGLAFWQKGRDKRVLFVTPGYQLVAVDAATGRPVPGFGKSGIVDLRATLDQGRGWDVNQIGTNSPPTVVGDAVIVGAAHTPFAPAGQPNNVIGYIRAFDVATGRLLWTFHTIPRRGEPGFETWLDGSALEGGGAGNAGVWGTISADPQLGLVYLPVESPYGDMYGGLRPGANLYGESIVAVDLKTGQRRWHFQTSHHPLWDYDIPTAPILVDAVKDGKTVKALAQATKQGLLFVLNRETGEPIWPIPEVAVPQGNVPGEVVLADAADSAPAVRSPRRRDRRPDRLHPSVAGRGRGDRREAPDRTDLHAGRAVRPERAAQHANGDGREQLAGRLVRSRVAHRVRHRERRREQHDDLPVRGRLPDAIRHLPRSGSGPVRGHTRRECSGPAVAQAAVRDDRRVRSHQGREDLGDPERRDAGRDQEPSRACRSEDGPDGPRGPATRRARDEDAADRVGAGLRPDARRQARLDAARARQADGTRGRGAAAAGAADGLADDVPAGRPPVPS